MEIVTEQGRKCFKGDFKGTYVITGPRLSIVPFFETGYSSQILCFKDHMLFPSLVVALKCHVDLFHYFCSRFPTTRISLTPFLSQNDNGFGSIVQPVMFE